MVHRQTITGARGGQLKRTKRGDRGRIPSQLHHCHILGSVEVQFPQVAILDVVQQVLMDGEGWALTLQLEDYHAAVVACSRACQQPLLAASLYMYSRTMSCSAPNQNKTTDGNKTNVLTIAFTVYFNM